MSMLETITRVPLSIGIWRHLVTKAKIPLGSVANRVQYGIFDYPHYAYGVYWSAYLASRLRLSLRSSSASPVDAACCRPVST